MLMDDVTFSIKFLLSPKPADLGLNIYTERFFKQIKMEMVEFLTKHFSRKVNIHFIS